MYRVVCTPTKSVAYLSHRVPHYLKTTMRLSLLRPLGDQVDSGAIEFSPTFAQFLRRDVNAAHSTTITSVCNPFEAQQQPYRTTCRCVAVISYSTTHCKHLARMSFVTLQR